ncbi:MAG: YeeE/YedE thiosulfate transporter family protein [Xanthobacteraceae bacterium]|nr:YeeE/YedE thiosulfate transporter family protein [Xanthobacteraceae bacterium]
MSTFDPVSATLGGLLIGLGTVLLMTLIGRTAGISGIFASALDPQHGGRAWRVAFVVGLVAAPLAVAAAGHTVAAPDMPGWAAVTAGGLLVGFGTRLSGGCTSGHGVCGIARLSPRSLVATGTFMLTAAVVVAVSRHVLGGL